MTAPSSPVPPARLSGFLYLIVIACGLFAVGYVRASLVVSGDAAATANNIIASEALYRLGVAAQVVMYVAYVAVTAIFYALFKPVSGSASLLAAFFSLVGLATGAANIVNDAAPWIFLGGADYLAPIATPQRQALAYLFLRLSSVGFGISSVFFGLYCVAIGGLILRSTFLPGVLGALMAIGGVCYVADSFVTFLSPPLAAQLNPYITLPGLVGELLLSLWLFLIGVNVAKWKARAGVA